MDLFNLAAKLTLDSSEYNSGVGRAEGALSKLGGLAKKTGVVVAGVFTTAAGAVAGLTKSAVEAYTEYEQLVGGIETLFQSAVDESDSAANKVFENAQKAFETAGMSANEYMETATSFSAALIKSAGRGEQQDLEALKETLDNEYTETKRSLDDQYAARKSFWDEQIRLEKNKSKKQSLKEARDAELKSLKRSNEDTLAELKKHNKEALAEAEASNMASETSEESLKRSAELTDLAIRDMSDNANKMGTDIESIQNAYAGFAKQNYTMLDNLKLGYGGTKEGMEELLKDAERISGVKYDMSSFADIVEAIHVVQTELGISGLSAEEAAEMVEKGLLTEEEAYEKMGTTAKEAQTTIEGSSKAMKAAWQNMLVALADKKGDTKKATQNLVRTAKTYFKNISPVITQAISSIGDFLGEVAPIIGEELPKILVDVIPKLFAAGKNLIKGLVKGIFVAVKQIKLPTWEDVKNIATAAWETITSAVAGLGGLIFGKNEKGEVNWPTWDDIVAVAEQLWKDIIAFVAKLPSTIGSLIFGKNEDGKVNYPTWEDVKKAVTGAWDTIVAEAAKLTGFNLGDISSVADLIGKIKDGWETLRNTIEQKAIEIGTYFFGEGNEEKVTNAIKTILDLVTALGAGIGAYMAVKNIEKLITTIKSFFTLDAGTSKVGLALGAIATLATLIYENWDKIQPILDEAWTWFDTNIIQPLSQFFKDISEWVDGAIQDIRKLLGLDYNDRAGEGLLTKMEADELSQDFMNALYEPSEESKQRALTEFYDNLKKTLEDAGFTAEEVAESLEKVKDIDNYKDMEAFLSALVESKTKSEELKSAVESIPTDPNITVHIGVDDPNGMLNFGTGNFVRHHRFGDNSDLHPEGFAKGLPTVPYDNFLANLHRGEMVLSSSQARDYRNGNGGVDLSGLEDRIEAAIRNGMSGVTVRSYLNGKELTDEVNRNTVNQVKARRFA